MSAATHTPPGSILRVHGNPPGRGTECPAEAGTEAGSGTRSASAWTFPPSTAPAASQPPGRFLAENRPPGGLNDGRAYDLIAADARAGKPAPRVVDIAARLNIADNVASQTVRRLVRHGRLVMTQHPNGRVYAAADGSWSTAPAPFRAPPRDPRNQPRPGAVRMRRCLGRPSPSSLNCDKEFLSSGPGHRICGDCRGHTTSGWLVDATMRGAREK